MINVLGIANVIINQSIQMTGTTTHIHGMAVERLNLFKLG